MRPRGLILARHLRADHSALKDPEYVRELLKLLRRNGIIAPIAGGAQNLMAGLTTQIANVALTTSPANLFPASGNPLVLSTPQAAPSLIPWGLGFAYVQDVTGVSTLASVVTALNAVVNGTTVQIGQSTSYQGSAGSGTIDTGITLGLIPSGATEITATGDDTAGTGTVTNSATAPSILGALSFL